MPNLVKLLEKTVPNASKIVESLDKLSKLPGYEAKALSKQLKNEYGVFGLSGKGGRTAEERVYSNTGAINNSEFLAIRNKTGNYSIIENPYSRLEKNRYVDSTAKTNPNLYTDNMHTEFARDLATAKAWHMAGKDYPEFNRIVNTRAVTELPEASFNGNQVNIIKKGNLHFYDTATGRGMSKAPESVQSPPPQPKTISVSPVQSTPKPEPVQKSVPTPQPKPEPPTQIKSIPENPRSISNPAPQAPVEKPKPLNPIEENTGRPPVVTPQPEPAPESIATTTPSKAKTRIEASKKYNEPEPQPLPVKNPEPLNRVEDNTGKPPASVPTPEPPKESPEIHQKIEETKAEPLNPIRSDGMAKIKLGVSNNTISSVKSIASNISNKMDSWGDAVANSSGGRFFSGMVKFDEDGIPNGFTGRGKLAIAGLGALSIGYNAMDERYHNDMGTTDGKIYTNTPDYVSMAQKKNREPINSVAGADGSLVFALDKLRGRGFL